MTNPFLQQASRVGQGTWNIERAKDRAGAILALQRGIDLGLNHIDTAEMYGDGEAEKLVGEAIRGRREGLFLVSKVLPSNASRNGTIAACERSLRRLGVDSLDCYLLHWRGSYRLADTVAGFEQLMSEGKILSWGVSNFDVDDLEELFRETHKLPACNQVLYYLQERAIEHAVIPWCEQHGVPVVAYSPFGQHRFPDLASSAGRALARIAERYGATPRQVALQYLMRFPAVFPIPKAANVEHVVENAGALGIALQAADINEIDAAFPLGRRPRSLPML